MKNTHTKITHALESDTLPSILFQKYSLGFPREYGGNPPAWLGTSTAATPTHLRSFASEKRQSRNSNRVRTKNVLSSLHKAINPVQPFVLKDKLINNTTVYCCAPPRTPINDHAANLVHREIIQSSSRKGCLREGKSAIQRNPGLLPHVTVAWCLTTPWLPAPHPKLAWTYVLVSVKTQSWHSASPAQKDEVIHKSSKFINQIL